MSTSQLHPRAVDAQVVHAGQVGQAGGAAGQLGVTDVRCRWRSSASVPVSTVRPSRMIVTRSHSASTSARMWLDSSTVRPASRSLGDALAGRPPPSAGRGPEVGSSSSSSSTSEASAATSATFCRLPLE